MRGSVVCVEGRDDLKSGKNKQSKSLFTSSWQFCVDCSQQWTKDKVYAVQPFAFLSFSFFVKLNSLKTVEFDKMSVC